MASFTRYCAITESVPDDVWRLIFGQVVAESDAHHKNIPINTNALKVAIKLSHVCVCFRHVAIQQKELWNKIPVSIVLDDEERAQFLDQDIVDIALERALELPLVLNLRVDAAIPRSRACTRHPGFIGVLIFLKCIHRARVLSIDHTAIRACGQYLNLMNTLRADGTSWPCLEYISYYGLPSEIRGSIAEIISKFSKKSNCLKTLKVFREQGVYVDWTGFKFTFDHLLDLEIGGPITFLALYSILSSTKSLSVCAIHELWDQEKPDLVLGINSISLPFLAKLCIRGSRPIPYDTVTQILALIAAPLLEVFCLTECDWCPLNMSRFLQNSTFMLRQLSFEGVKIGPDELLDFLNFLPCLDVLALDLFFLPEDNNLFARRMMALDANGQHFQLCPELRILHVFYTCKNGLSQATPISDMVEKRMWGCENLSPRLNEVRIFQFNPRQLSRSFIMGETQSTEITQLLALKKAGLNIIFELGCR